MSFAVRLMQPGDFEQFRSWYGFHEQETPPEDSFPPSSTFVCQLLDESGDPEKTSLMCSVSLWNTNTGSVIYANFIGNPLMKGALRKRATQALFQYTAIIAQQIGYKRIMAYASNSKLADYYGQLGFQKRQSGLCMVNFGLLEEGV